VNLIVLAVHLNQLRDPGQESAQALDRVTVGYTTAVLRHKDPMGM